MEWITQMRFQDKVAVITGSTQGIGRGMARRFAAEGAAVVVVGRNQEKGQAVQQEILEQGGMALYVQADVSQPRDMEEMVEAALRHFGQIDILVNNAGVNVGRGTPFFEMTLDHWRQTIETNLTGTFLCSRAVARHMISRRQGKIVNIASVFAFAAATGNAPYAASKGGLIQLTRAMAIDLAPYGVYVNAIAPGAIAIESAPEVPDVINDYILLRRWGAIDEVASVALFLASEESGYINGAVVTVDGGLMTLLPGKPLGTP